MAYRYQLIEKTPPARPRKKSALLGGCVFLSISLYDTAHGLDDKDSGYIQKKDITCACIACKLTTLDSSTDRYALIWVKGFIRLLPSSVLLSPDCQHTVNRRLTEPCQAQHGYAAIF